MTHIMVDGIIGFDRSSIQSKGFPGVRINIKSGEVAAGDIDPNTMSLLEDIGRAECFDSKEIDFTRLHQLLPLRGIPVSGSDDSVGQVHLKPRWKIFAGGIDIYQFGSKIRIRRV